MLGFYGAQAASLLEDPPVLSLRRCRGEDVDRWRARALAKLGGLVAAPPPPPMGPPRVLRRHRHDGLDIDVLEWDSPGGRPTEAYFLRPQGSAGPLPAVLALHDHGGLKYYGKRKIADPGDTVAPVLMEHHRTQYEGRCWANEVARRGYAVLVHDTFPFESRRIRYTDVPTVLRGGLEEHDDPLIEDVLAYNRWAAEQESVIARSLISAGATWPGVCFREDQRALDYLCARPEVDPRRVACGGLSGGGLRTVYLAGMDTRIRAAFCVGFMTTWRDLVLDKSHTHTWMTYTPGLPRYLDFPEILALRVPAATLVMCCEHDELFSLREMRRATGILAEVFGIAGASARLRIRYTSGVHRFDAAMQTYAFSWLDEELASSGT